MKLPLVGFALLVMACNGSKAAPKEEAKGTAKVTETSTTEAPKSPAPTPADPDKCGDGKLTFISSTSRSERKVTVYCHKGTPGAVLASEYRGEEQGTEKRPLTMAQWNALWALADEAGWKTANKQCPDDSAEVDEPDYVASDITIHRDGITKTSSCDFTKLMNAMQEILDSSDPAVADVNPAVTITATNMGPLTKKTTFSLDAVKALIPGDWKEEENEAEGMLSTVLDNGAGLRLHEDGGTVTMVEVMTASYSTAAGIHVDSSGADLAKAYSDLACANIAEDGIGVECHSQNLTFHLEGPDVPAGSLGAKRVAKHKIDRITWN